MDDSNKKRKKYITEKSIRIDSLLDAAKQYKFQYKPTPVNLAKDHSEVKLLTQDTCLRPDLYLDNDSTCVKCKLYEYCSCKLKNMGNPRRKS